MDALVISELIKGLILDNGAIQSMFTTAPELHMNLTKHRIANRVPGPSALPKIEALESAECLVHMSTMFTGLK